jgi:hypothetical protein
MWYDKVYRCKNGFQVTAQYVYDGFKEVTSWVVVDPKNNRVAGTDSFDRAREIAINGGLNDKNANRRYTKYI